MLIFVGVGPGDPELVTMKAVRILQQADAIALPDSGRGDSAVMKIVGQWIQDKPICRISIPMTGMRSEWKAAHEKAADTIKELMKQYPNLAYPVLGDPSVYASSSYLVHLLEPDISCTVVPGITTMCAAAAELNIPLCEQGESLTVLDHLAAEDPLPQSNAVIMKSGKKLAELKALVGDRPAYAVRNLGMQDEWRGNLRDIAEEDYSYFTTVIVKEK